MRSLEATELAGFKVQADLPGEHFTLPLTALQMYFLEVCGRGAGSVFAETK